MSNQPVFLGIGNARLSFKYERSIGSIAFNVLFFVFCVDIGRRCIPCGLGLLGFLWKQWNRVACSWFIFGVIKLPFRFHFVEWLQSGSRLIVASRGDFDWRNQNGRRSPSLVRRRRQIRTFNSPWTGRIFKASRYDKNHNYHCQMEIQRWLFSLFLILSSIYCKNIRNWSLFTYYDYHEGSTGIGIPPGFHEYL